MKNKTSVRVPSNDGCSSLPCEIIYYWYCNGSMRSTASEIVWHEAVGGERSCTHNGIQSRLAFPIHMHGNCNFGDFKIFTVFVKWNDYHSCLLCLQYYKSLTLHSTPWNSKYTYEPMNRYICRTDFNANAQFTIFEDHFPPPVRLQTSGAVWKTCRVNFLYWSTIRTAELKAITSVPCNGVPWSPLPQERYPSSHAEEGTLKHSRIACAGRCCKNICGKSGHKISQHLKFTRTG